MCARDPSRPPPPSDRVAFGRAAEDHVARWYEDVLEHEIKHRNLRLGPDELDIVVERDGCWRVVEVRATARRSSARIGWSLVGRKARRLRRAIRSLRRSGLLGEARSLTLDVALVTRDHDGKWRVEIWPDALPLDGDGW